MTHASSLLRGLNLGTQPKSTVINTPAVSSDAPFPRQTHNIIHSEIIVDLIEVMLRYFDDKYDRHSLIPWVQTFSELTADTILRSRNISKENFFWRNFYITCRFRSWIFMALFDFLYCHYWRSCQYLIFFLSTNLHDLSSIYISSFHPGSDDKLHPSAKPLIGRFWSARKHL